jgi:trehalose 6-phosphate synthase
MPVEKNSNLDRLSRLCKERMEQRHLIVASNRGPFEYRITENGVLRPRRGGGGVVTVLDALSRYIKLTWIASAMGEGDRRMAGRMQGGRFRAPTSERELYLRFVVTPRNIYHKFYSIFCNPLLWFLQHYMWNSSHTPNIDGAIYDAWANGYIPVNQAFAQAVIAEAKEYDSPLVMLNDYHLYLVAGYIRQEMLELDIQHFIHIPWPTVSYWQLLPSSMRDEICKGLCANDIVGFQTMRDVHNFLHTCETFLAGAEADYRECTVCFQGHLTRVRTYPVSVDVASLERIASSPRGREYEEKLRPLCGEQTIIRVDRAEPSKNIVRGFRAFNLLLQRYPELVGKVKLLAFLVPTRTHLKPYKRYLEEITQLIETINTKYGSEKWRPIELFYENNRPQALAAMRFYDVLLVNSVIDGMNLVSKEGPVLNTCDGVLILSEGVGAHVQLGEYALSVAPADIEGTVEALYQALTMPAEERKRRATALKRSIAQEDATMWIYRQIEDLLKLPQRQLALAI